MEQTPRLVGPHELRLQVQKGLREVNSQQHVGRGCGHSCTHEDDGLDFDELDAGLAQCCIKERETKKKNAVVWRALESADPVKRAEEKRMVGKTAETPMSWMQVAQKKHCGKQACEHCSEECEHDDSDDELDAFLEGFEENVLKGDPGNECFLSRCSSDSELATFLSPQENSSCFAKVVIFTAETAPGLSSMLEEEVRRVKYYECLNTPNLLAVVSVPFVVIGRDHPLFRSQWFMTGNFPLEPPFLIAFEPSTLLPIEGFSRRTLEKGISIFRSWWGKFQETSEESRRRAGDVQNEDAEEDRPTSSFCGRPDCERTFPHEHVKRQMQNYEYDIGENDEIEKQ